MNEFNDCGCVDVLVAGVAERPRRQQYDQWSQSFAATGYNICGYLGDQRDVTAKAFADQCIDRAHVGAGEVIDVGKRGRNGLVFGGLHCFADNA